MTVFKSLLQTMLSENTDYVEWKYKCM